MAVTGTFRNCKGSTFPAAAAVQMTAQITVGRERQAVGVALMQRSEAQTLSASGTSDHWVTALHLLLVAVAVAARAQHQQTRKQVAQAYQVRLPAQQLLAAAAGQVRHKGAQWQAALVAVVMVFLAA